MFKKFVLSVILLVAVAGADAQFRKIPAAVTDAFDTRYPDAKHVNWSDQVVAFVAEFKVDGEEVKASYNSKGVWLKSTRKTSLSKLSADVKDGLNKSMYTDWTVAEVVELQEVDKELQYRLFVKKGDSGRRNLFFNQKGQLVKDQITL
jgi:predicted metal-dependent peptidase